VISCSILTNAADSFVNSRIYIFDKTNIYAGGTSPVLVTNLSKNDDGFGQIPALTYDTNMNELFLLQNWNSTNGVLKLWKIDGPVNSPSLSMVSNTGNTNASMTWAFSATNTLFRQANTNAKVFPGDARIQSVVVRNKSIFAVHHIFLPSSSPTYSAIQLWQLKTNGLPVGDALRLKDTSGVKSYAFPSLAVNKWNVTV